MSGTYSSELDARFNAVRAEWLAIAQQAAPDSHAFERVRHEADALISAGLWTSGPADLLSVLGRQRDELAHSRLIAWLLVPTNRHGLGRRFLVAFLDHLWPGEALMARGPVSVETEVVGAGLDATDRTREARADIILRGGGLTVLIENKLDAGEQPDQCERLYWGWANEPGETRWVFLTPTGREPTTTVSDTAKSAWRTMSYRNVRDVAANVLSDAIDSDALGLATARQYLETLTRAVVL
jgi:hypothetical protein